MEIGCAYGGEYGTSRDVGENMSRRWFESRIIASLL